ncbi:MAG: Ig-like domain-containing protein, partial [Pseudomonadota bacterium]
MPFSSLINGTFNSGSAFDFRIKTNGGRNRFGFDGDDFYIRGQGVQGKQRFDNLDDFFGLAVTVFGGSVVQDAQFLDADIAAGKLPTDLRVEDGSLALIEGAGITGSFKARFDSNAHAQNFLAFVEQMTSLIDANDAIAADPSEFRFAVGEIEVFYDASAQDFGFKNDTGAQQRFDALEPFVEALARDLGGTQTRDGTFNEERIADGRGPSIRVQKDTDLLIAGRSVSGRFKFEFDTAEQAETARQVFTQLFADIAETGAIGGEGLPGAEDTSTGIDADAAEGLIAITPDAGPASQAIFAAPSASPASIPATTAAPTELSQVEAGQGGFVINGASAGDQSGYSVSNAGDVNGDGLDDLVIGANAADPNGGNSGASYVVFGKTDSAAIELSAIAAGSGGFVINGVSANDRAGGSVSGAGDINGDGLQDLIVGASFDGPNGSFSGASFVVFGKTDGASVELSNVETGAGGFAVNGANASDFAGRAVSIAGDVNGDGLDDLIIGASGDDPNGQSSGASFVVFGRTDSSALELSDIELGNGGFVINGASAGDQSGRAVSSAGDVNGDGLDDLVIGAPVDDPNGSASGASFVVFGKTDGVLVEVSDIDAGVGGFAINGVSAGDQSGRSVSTAGDVNGDGLEDLIIGASSADPNAANAGASYVVFGKTDAGAVELSDVEAGAGGFVINGISATDFSGFSVSTAGDINGDGLTDLIIGANLADPNGDSSGASYVVFGKTDTSATELSDVENGSGGFILKGVSAGDRAGNSVSGAGDINGDGFDDIIVGAPFDDPNGSSSGASFVVFGGNFSGAATQIGTTGVDTLTGTNASDTLIAGTDNDILIGNGGSDVLRAGEGDDVVAISDLSFNVVDGGNGVDTLRLDGSGLTLDLAAVADTRLSQIEAIDLAGNGNTLVVDRLEVLRLSGETNTLRVFGQGVDTFEFATGTAGDWQQLASIIDDGITFDVFVNGRARVEIQQGIGDLPDASDDTARTDEDTAVTINVLDNDAGSGLVITAIDGTPISTGETVTLASGANVTLNVDGTVDYGPNDQFEGLSSGDSTTDSFSYTVEGGGQTRQADVTVTIDGVEDAPVVTADTARTDEDTAVSIDVLDNDVDPDSTLVIAALNGTNVVAGQTVTLASGAIVTLNQDGTVDYDPNGQFEDLSGGDSTTDSFSYTIDADGETRQATVTVTIDGVEDAPVANPDTARTDEDTAVTIDVLANDTDPDSDLVITQVDGTPISAGQTVTLASGALVTLNIDGTVDYDPNGQFEGFGSGDSTTDSFIYTIDADGETVQATATITIDGVDDLPSATDDTARTDEDTAVTIDVLNNDSDPDGDLVITAIAGTPIAAGQTVTLASGALVTLNVDGTVDYDPNDQFEDLSGGGDSTTDSFSYTVEGGGQTRQASVTVTIDGVEDAPVVAADTVRTDEDTAVTVDVLNNDNDPDSTLTITALDGTTVVAGDSVTLASGAIVTLNQNGTVDYDPNDQFEDLSGGDSTTDSFTYTIDADGETQQATVTVTIDGIEDAPIANDDTALTDKDTAISVAVLANDIDPDSTLTVSSLEGASVQVGETITLASGALITLNQNGTVEYNPNGQFDSLAAGASATDSFTYAIDGDGEVDQATVTVTISGVGAGSPVTELSTIEAGTGGFVINGVSENDVSGVSVSNAGDVNGDGL